MTICTPLPKGTENTSWAKQLNPDCRAVYENTTKRDQKSMRVLPSLACVLTILQWSQVCLKHRFLSNVQFTVKASRL